ncbi:EpsG family protein [Sphingobacterium micropteri]|uniref:EpsG family protein n=1 Tax=Sphingobacterium micropteri TaxID=2763501 RepID=UPI001CC2DEF7
MAIYVFILIIILFLLALRVKNTLFLATTLVIFSSLRDLSVGVDSMGYYLSFLYEISARNYSYLLRKIEVGWLFLNLLIQEYFGDFKMVLVVSSCLTIFPLFHVFKKDTSNPILAILLYFLLFYYFFSYSIMRQAIAVSFFTLSVYYFERNKMRGAIIAICCAGIFHYSSLSLILLVLLLNKVNFSLRWYVTTFIGSFILGFSGIMDVARQYLAYLPFEKYANYMNYNLDAEFNRFASYLFLLPKLTFYIYLYSQIYRSGHRISSLQLKLIWFSMIITCLFLSVPQISRFSIYLSIFEILVIVNTIDLSVNKRKIELTFFTIAYGIIYFLYYVVSNRYGVMPYVFG